jgi:hypothetical protein
MSKTLVFSDSLTLPKSLEIFRALRGRINVSFGIGTNLTCDIPGVEPMSIVLKMTACNGQPVAKISDEPARLTAKTRISSPICDTFSKFLPFPAYLARSEFMQAVQREIAEQLKVQPPFAGIRPSKPKSPGASPLSRTAWSIPAQDPGAGHQRRRRLADRRPAGPARHA